VLSPYFSPFICDSIRRATPKLSSFAHSRKFSPSLHETPSTYSRFASSHHPHRARLLTATKTKQVRNVFKIEQYTLFAPFTISYECNPRIRPGRKYMMVRSSLLLGGVILLAAIPVCADTIFYAASTNEPSSPESSAPTIRTSHSRFLGAMTEKLIEEPLLSTTPAGSFALPKAAIAEDSLSTEIAGKHTRTFALAVADPEDFARPSGPGPVLLSVNGFQPGGAFASSGPASSDFSTEGARFGFFGNDPDHDRDGKGKKKIKNQDGLPVNVPEPGALPLLTLGLLAVGIVAARNRDLATKA
jgi:hypothetical protein